MIRIWLFFFPDDLKRKNKLSLKIFIFFTAGSPFIPALAQSPKAATCRSENRRPS
jgi:hypothetical protein